MTTSADWPVAKWVEDTIAADVAIGLLLDDAKPVHVGEASQGAALPYIVVGDSSEGGFRAVGRGGSDVEGTLKIWTPGSGKKAGGLILAELMRLFGGVRPTGITGHTGVYATLRKVTDFANEDKSARCHVLKLRVLAREGV